jgi:NitT/TauT family transport system substrate-binding protein
VFSLSSAIVWKASLALLLTALFGCEQRAEPDAQPASSALPVEVRIGYFANLTHSQAVLGISSGEFASAVAPVKVTPRVFNAGPSLIEALFAGEIDVGYVGPGPVLAAHQRSHGEALRVIAGAAANGVVIVAGPHSGINSLADLVGKRIATPQSGNTQDISARHYLVNELEQPNTNNVLPIANTEQQALLARGNIDAAWVPEPWASRLIVEAGGKLVAEEKDLWPGRQFTLTLVVTTPQFLARHADLVEKMLAVHSSWTIRLNRDPQKYRKQLGEALQSLTGKSLPPGVIEQAMPRVRFTDEPLEDTLATMAQWAYDLRIVNRKPELAGLVDATLLGKARAAAPRE